MPIIAKSFGNNSSFAKLYSAGKSFRFVRSPPTPKITITHGPAARPACPPPALTFTAVTLASLLLRMLQNPRFPPFDILAFRGELFSGGAFDVAAELKSHRRKKLRGEFVFSARTEPFVERRAQHRRRRRFVNCRLNCPASFAGIRYPAGKFRQIGLLEKSDGRQIQKPRSDHAPAAPYL